MKESIMKNSILIFAAAVLTITSCSSGQYTASREYDDVYYSSEDRAREGAANTSQPASSSSNDNSSREESIGNDNGTSQDRFGYENSGTQNREPDYTSTQ